MASRAIYDESHEMFRDSVRRFFQRELLPHVERWEEQGFVDREFFKRAGEAGLMCPTVPPEFGGPGLDFRYNAIVSEEIANTGYVVGLTLQSDIICDYLLSYASDELKQRWLPRLVSGESIAAIAMTEPGAGSDLKGIRATARREGGNYFINGSKTYISAGSTADFVLVVVKTDPERGAKGTSIIIVEANREGFRRGRRLEKIGQWASDTAELFFDNVRVPVANLIGNENEGFLYLMKQLPRERLSMAVLAQAGAQRAFEETLSFTKSRVAFGTKVFDFQNTRFTLADFAAKLQVGWAHLDWAILRHVEGKLTAEEAAAAKLWHTETQWQIVDGGLQLHGGAGYMNEYPIARLWRDARVQRIYGGTSEIMKELIGRRL